jgi:hypothetical protein
VTPTPAPRRLTANALEASPETTMARVRAIVGRTVRLLRAALPDHRPFGFCSSTNMLHDSPLEQVGDPFTSFLML